eukprot:4841271-Pyramimonas_sp.AAC.1
MAAWSPCESSGGKPSSPVGRALIKGLLAAVLTNSSVTLPKKPGALIKGAHHDAVGPLQDGVEVDEPLVILHLADDADGLPPRIV